MVYTCLQVSVLFCASKVPYSNPSTLKKQRNHAFLSEAAHTQNNSEAPSAREYSKTPSLDSHIGAITDLPFPPDTRQPVEKAKMQVFASYAICPTHKSKIPSYKLSNSSTYGVGFTPPSHLNQILHPPRRHAAISRPFSYLYCALIKPMRTPKMVCYRYK